MHILAYNKSEIKEIGFKKEQINILLTKQWLDLIITTLIGNNQECYKEEAETFSGLQECDWERHFKSQLEHDFYQT